jgi:(S)-2-hydroxyglutarate dehydrogenase
MARDGKWGMADLLVVGAGVLGVSIAYWLSLLYDCRILLVDKEEGPGAHASTRNTGVIHRPFYLNPRSKRVFALSSQLSYPMWQSLAKEQGLPWLPVGTLNVAARDADVDALQEYVAWSEANGLTRAEVSLLDREAVRALEPQVECKAGFLSSTDVSVDFGRLTRGVMSLAMRNGVVFAGGSACESAEADGEGLRVKFVPGGAMAGVSCKFMINAMGGAALRLAHSRGLGLGYSTLNFRGEYWIVGEPFASKVTRNIYTPPLFPQFPFLDPHFVVRSDGSRQIGPNAALVTGPYVYSGVGLSTALDLLRPPLVPKLRLFSNGPFLSMLAGEWRSSLSKRVMCGRVRKFVPGLRPEMLRTRGIAGVRTSMVDRRGFVPEAVLVTDSNSAHILNYNSPGATGAPAYSAMVVASLQLRGLLDGLPRRPLKAGLQGWDFNSVPQAF